MAAIGDILVKFIADFGSFSSQMKEGMSQLEEFAKKAGAVSGTLEKVFSVARAAGPFVAAAIGIKAVADDADRLQKKFTEIAETADKLGVSFQHFETLRLNTLKSGEGVDKLIEVMGRFKSITDQALQGNATIIQSLNKLGVTVLDVNGKQRSQEDINRRIAEAFDKMPDSLEKTRLEFTLLGQAGDDVNKQFKLLLKSYDDLGNQKDMAFVKASIDNLKEMENRLKGVKEQNDLVMAQLLLPLKEGWLNATLNLMQALEELSYKVGDALRAIGLIDTPRSYAAEWARVTAQMAAAKKEFDYYTEQQERASRQGMAQSAIRPLDEAAARAAKRMKELEEEQGRLRAQYQGPEGYSQTMPPVVVTGKRPDGSNPPPVTTGGGGGRTDAETIAALQARYEKMRDAALEAAAQVRANTKLDADDLALMVEAKQAAAEAMARIEQKGIKVDPKDLALLEQTIFLAKQAQAEQQRDLQYAKQAEDTQRRLGDGTEARNRAMRELNRQLATGRLHEDAYQRAVKESTEATEQAARQARRYDDNLGSLVAGVEHSAQAYARSNDLFSQGGQLFNAFTTAMGEGLDALMGKSDKTFGQIAADFAQMLARMALAAATSEVFKAIFGTISAAGGLFGDTLPADVAGPVRPGIFGLGGNRAVGGDVYPDRSYMVGEFGPERFVPHTAGKIEPFRANDNGGGVTVNVDMGTTEGTNNPSQALEFGRRVRAAVVQVIAQEKRPGGTLYSRANA